MKDIRLFPWTIGTINGKSARVHHFRGFRCGMTDTILNYPHAPVYLYTVQYPDGHYQEGIDLAEVNKIIFDNV